MKIRPIFYWLQCLVLTLALSFCSNPSGYKTENSSESEKPILDSQARQIIDEAIKVHGGDKYNTAHIEFDFRGRRYTSSRNQGIFIYERIFPDTVKGKPVIITDVLNNEGFKRMVGEDEMPLNDDFRARYSRSVNSVLYFVQLPYGLNDQAVTKKYLGQSSIRGEPYDKVEVTFEQESGGEDFQDVFIYWFHRENKTMDYFAYSYLTDNGGLRFRESINPRTINGIRFSDYINYKADYNKYKLADLEQLFNKGQLEEASRIISENIDVELGSD